METKTLPKFSTKFGNLAFVLVTMARSPRPFFTRKEIQDAVKAWRAPDANDPLVATYAPIKAKLDAYRKRYNDEMCCDAATRRLGITSEDYRNVFTSSPEYVAFNDEWATLQCAEVHARDAIVKRKGADPKAHLSGEALWVNPYNCGRRVDNVTINGLFRRIKKGIYELTEAGLAKAKKLEATL